MKKITKIILPLVFAFTNTNFISNSLYKPDISINEIKEHYFNEEKKRYESIIYEYFKEIDKVIYMSDLYRHGIKDFWQTPFETDSLCTGDCEDKAIKTYYDLSNKGLELGLVWGKKDKCSEIGHFWNEFEIGDSVYIIETSRVKGCAIIKKDTLNLKEKYLPAHLTSNELRIIRNFEERSGMKIDFKNYDFKQP